MKDNKGFTLVELLATILLIGVIALIAVPVYNNYIETSREEAVKDSMYTLIGELESYVLSNGTVDFTNKTDLFSVNINVNNYDFTSGSFVLTDNFIVLINVTDGDYCINGNKNNLEIVAGAC